MSLWVVQPSGHEWVRHHHFPPQAHHHVLITSCDVSMKMAKRREGTGQDKGKENFLEPELVQMCSRWRWPNSLYGSQSGSWQCSAETNPIHTHHHVYIYRHPSMCVCTNMHVYWGLERKCVARHVWYLEMKAYVGALCKGQSTGFGWQESQRLVMSSHFFFNHHQILLTYPLNHRGYHILISYIICSKNDFFLS